MQFEYEDFFMRLDAVMLEARSGAGYLGQRVSKAGDELFLVHYWLYRNSARVNACNREMLDDMVLDVYVETGSGSGTLSSPAAPAPDAGAAAPAGG